MRKFIKSIVSAVIVIGVCVAAAMTRPSTQMHKDKVIETVRNEIKRELSLQKDGNWLSDLVRSGMASLGSMVVPATVNNLLVVDDFWLFSIGTINDSDGVHFVSFGAFNHVFVFPMYLDKLITTIVNDQ